MIRRGRLRWPDCTTPKGVQTWTEETFPNSFIHNVQFGHIPSRGTAVTATCDMDGSNASALMSIEPTMIINKRLVEAKAKSSIPLAQLIESLGNYINTARGAILTFLLYATTNKISTAAGIPLDPESSAFNEYVWYLPFESLPTTWSKEEIALLQGTSLYAATQSKIRSLKREFEHVCDLSANIAWTKEHWFSDQSLTKLEFEDWQAIDSWYRSRALEGPPGWGEAMIPCIDMCNHAAAPSTRLNAKFEVDSKTGHALLLLHEDAKVRQGDEINISYGDNKGAAEMLFSYGFLDSEMSDAKELFLPLQMSDDDPLAEAKMHVSDAAPGVKLECSDSESAIIEWLSPFIWLAITNEEDGLGFEWSDGNPEQQRELHLLWKGQHIPSAATLHQHLATDENYPLFRLRAVMTIATVIEEHVAQMLEVDAPSLKDEGVQVDGVRAEVLVLAGRLAELEYRFMREALRGLERERDELMGNDVVVAFLGRQQDG